MNSPNKVKFFSIKSDKATFVCFSSLKGTIAIFAKSFDPWEISIFNFASIIAGKNKRQIIKNFISLVL